MNDFFAIELTIWLNFHWLTFRNSLVIVQKTAYSYQITQRKFYHAFDLKLWRVFSLSTWILSPNIINNSDKIDFQLKALLFQTLSMFWILEIVYFILRIGSELSKNVKIFTHSLPSINCLCDYDVPLTQICHSHRVLLFRTPIATNSIRLSVLFSQISIHLFPLKSALIDE